MTGRRFQPPGRRAAAPSPSFPAEPEGELFDVFAMTTAVREGQRV